jgi:hypothetical protein
MMGRKAGAETSPESSESSLTGAELLRSMGFYPFRSTGRCIRIAG